MQQRQSSGSWKKWEMRLTRSLCELGIEVGILCASGHAAKYLEKMFGPVVSLLESMNLFHCFSVNSWMHWMYTYFHCVHIKWHYVIKHIRTYQSTCAFRRQWSLFLINFIFGCPVICFTFGIHVWHAFTFHFKILDVCSTCCETSPENDISNRH